MQSPKYKIGDSIVVRNFYERYGAHAGICTVVGININYVSDSYTLRRVHDNGTIVSWNSNINWVDRNADYAVDLIAQLVED